MPLPVLLIAPLLVALLPFVSAALKTMFPAPSKVRVRKVLDEYVAMSNSDPSKEIVAPEAAWIFLEEALEVMTPPLVKVSVALPESGPFTKRNPLRSKEFIV